MGLAALGALLLSYLRLFEFHPLLYPGGFVLVSLATIAAIIAVTHPAACVMPLLLGWKPLTWIGLRSYGIYLWHWPIFMVTRPYIDVSIDGWQLFALRFAAVLALSELSFRFVEMPVRRSALAPAWQRLRALAASPFTKGAFAGRRSYLVQRITDRTPASSGAGLPAQPVPAQVLIDTSSQHVSARRSRAQRNTRSSHVRKRHHRRPAI